MDVSFLGGPEPQRGVGIVAPFDFALDRELWRWVPDDVSLHLTRTPFVPVEVSLDLARLVSEHETLRAAVRALSAVSPEVVAYACTSGSFVGGQAGELAMSAAMRHAGEMPALTTSGALLDALRELGAHSVALVTPYTKSVTDALEDFLGEAGIEVTGRGYLGLTREIWRVPYRDVTGMARDATAVGAPEALFISCTNLPTYDAIPRLETELGIPVLSANQVTVWAALRRIGKQAVGPYQALLEPVPRSGPAALAPADAEPATGPVTGPVTGPATGPAAGADGPGGADPGAGRGCDPGAGPAVPPPEPPVDAAPEVALAGSALPGADAELCDPLADPLPPDDPPPR
ncbi:aspartate/glutamate racemase family protein [Streptomyces sp. JJ66]|uniref:maleate cis-trans isomerase family protein n=1 Tax=Streptomyces sp. JJ66 TaxID=2803843 RepID=UPI001C58BB3E|nr:decarboxylase [Streptomyces sp. JJ66]MBW1603138.1 aspartate/glutamate racemase family protein [Streptomyces sp. JJ66]